MTTKEKAEVMLAHADGKLIQVKHKSESDAGFIPCETPSWDWKELIYRVKPSDPRRIWVNEYEHGDKFIHASLESAMNASSVQKERCKVSEFVEVIK